MNAALKGGESGLVCLLGKYHFYLFAASRIWLGPVVPILVDSNT